MDFVERLARPVGNLYVGTCGWSDPTLIRCGRFYPATARSAEARLRYYAQQFPLVEVDATYYAPPSERNAELWRDRTPPGFVFDVKAYGLLTHHPVALGSLPPEVRAGLRDPKPRVSLAAVPPGARKRIWSLHAAALRPLADAGKLGCVLFQFPSWFRASRANQEYLRSLPERLPYPMAVEFRGGGWMEAERRSETLALLERLGLAYVVVDEPQGFPSSTPPVVARTAPLAVFRFHGRNAETWAARVPRAADRFRYLYSDDELRRWVGPARRMAAECENVHLLMNNCYADHAVRNARQLAALLASPGRCADS